MNISIRKATKEDVPAMMRLIRELAEYEKAPNEVTLSEEEFAEDGFGSTPHYSAIVLESEQEVIGMALYFISYSTWKGKCMYLEDLIVTESERGKGHGGLLFKEMIKLAGEFGARRLSWQVLDWNEPAISFYKKYKADLDGEWINGKITEFMTKD